MFMEQTAQIASPAQSWDLASEAHHRIANSLTLISALLRQRAMALRHDDSPLSAEQVRSLLAEIEGRVNAAGRLHRMLSAAADEPVDVGIYLQQVVSELVTSLARPGSILHCGCELGCRAPPTVALRLGLIAVELVINSIKHAHPAGIQGEIELRCSRLDNGVVVDIADDGVGFPEGLDPTDDASSGLHLVYALARQIDAVVEFRSGSLGLRCAVTVPLPPAESGETSPSPAT